MQMAQVPVPDYAVLIIVIDVRAPRNVISAIPLISFIIPIHNVLNVRLQIVQLAVKKMFVKPVIVVFS